MIKTQSERRTKIQNAHNYIHSSLISNPRFIMDSIKYNTNMIKFLPTPMKCDKNLILHIINTTARPHLLLPYIVFITQ